MRIIIKARTRGNTRLTTSPTRLKRGLRMQNGETPRQTRAICLRKSRPKKDIVTRSTWWSLTIFSRIMCKFLKHFLCFHGMNVKRAHVNDSLNSIKALETFFRLHTNLRNLIKEARDLWRGSWAVYTRQLMIFYSIFHYFCFSTSNQSQTFQCFWSFFEFKVLVEDTQSYLVPSRRLLRQRARHVSAPCFRIRRKRRIAVRNVAPDRRS